MRHVLARNVRALMDKRYAEVGDRPTALAKAANTSLSTIQRVLRAGTGASIDTIEAIASVFELSAYQLLIPELDVGKPQSIEGAAKAEQRIFRNFQIERQRRASGDN